MQFDKKNLSPVSIAKELQDAVSSLPDGLAWDDYFSGGAGKTIIELIAGSQAIKNHYNLMRVREGTLQFAKLDSSVTELAINKGVYRPPAKSFIIEITFMPLVTGFLTAGQKIGTYKNYDIIVYETVQHFANSECKVTVTVGKVESYQETIFTAKDFLQVEITALHKYVAGEFQQLSINDISVSLIDEELNLYDPTLKDSCLRLSYDNYVKLVFGDGSIGKKLENNDILKFDFISFGDDLLENFNVDSMNLGGLIVSKEVLTIVVLRKPTKYLDKEILRKIAIRNSVDGRWVQTQDYYNGIMREFGEYIHDTIVKDNYPAEDITILPKEELFTPTIENSIRELIENKRGNAVLVNLNVLDPVTIGRLDVVFNVHYVGSETSYAISVLIDEYASSRENKIRYSGYKLSCSDIAVELTELASGKFYASLDEEIWIDPLQSLRNLTINFSR